MTTIRGRGQILREGGSKHSPGRGIKLFLKGGGGVGEKTKNATKFLKETKRPPKKYLFWLLREKKKILVKTTNFSFKNSTFF